MPPPFSIELVEVQFVLLDILQVEVQVDLQLVQEMYLNVLYLQQWNFVDLSQQFWHWMMILAQHQLMESQGEQHPVCSQITETEMMKLMVWLQRTQI